MDELSAENYPICSFQLAFFKRGEKKVILEKRISIKFLTWEPHSRAQSDIVKFPPKGPASRRRTVKNTQGKHAHTKESRRGNC